MSCTRARAQERALSDRTGGACSTVRQQYAAVAAEVNPLKEVYAIMQSPKQYGRTFVVGRPNRANGACFDRRRARQHVDRLKNHYLQTGEGWQNTVVPYWNLCEVRPQVSRHVASQNVVLFRIS